MHRSKTAEGPGDLQMTALPVDHVIEDQRAWERFALSAFAGLPAIVSFVRATDSASRTIG